MARKMKIRDRRKSSYPTTLVHFDPNEGWKRRHERRKETNLSHADDVQEWCNTNGFTMEIKNNGHHWIITGGCRVAEWWPSSAKLVFAKKYREGIHAHDVYQVMNEIRDRWMAGDCE